MFTFTKKKTSLLRTRIMDAINPKIDAAEAEYAEKESSIQHSYIQSITAAADQRDAAKEQVEEEIVNRFA
jgi:hypothetical protein